MEKWGYLRETKEKAQKAGKDPNTKIIRTGLDEYLQIIFPSINDWVHDKIIPNSKCRKRPDYRSETLKLIIEFNGLPHYQKPNVILNDTERKQLFESMGYKVVEIPYFIQLTNKAVKKWFNVDVKEPLFNEKIPSLFANDKCTPAYLCHLGIKRMAKDFKKFPEQYEINIKSMKSENNEDLTGVSLLIEEYEKLLN